MICVLCSIGISGVTGAAGKAYRLAEINKATNAFKLAKEGARMGAWGIAWAAAGCAFSVVDIAVNINELANGSVVPESKNYREVANDLERVIQGVENLLSIDVNRN